MTALFMPGTKNTTLTSPSNTAFTGAPASAAILIPVLLTVTL